MHFCYGSLRGQAQVRPIDKLDETYTNADDVVKIAFIIARKEIM